MATINQIPMTLMGNLVSDLEPKRTAGGKTVVNFRVAQTSVTEKNGKWEDGETTFIRCGSGEKKNSASGFGSMPMTTSENHTTGRRIGMIFVSRHTSPRPITVLKNHGRRSGTDSGAWAFLYSSRSNPPALSTACSTASLFSTGRWDASFSIVALRASFACST